MREVGTERRAKEERKEKSATNSSRFTSLSERESAEVKRATDEVATVPTFKRRIPFLIHESKRELSFYLECHWFLKFDLECHREKFLT